MKTSIKLAIILLVIFFLYTAIVVYFAYIDGYFIPKPVFSGCNPILYPNISMFNLSL
jgi:hypothetical protein